MHMYSPFGKDCMGISCLEVVGKAKQLISWLHDKLRSKGFLVDMAQVVWKVDVIDAIFALQDNWTCVRWLISCQSSILSEQ